MKHLSDEQQKAIEQRGRFVLLACPGSGKTFTVAHRLAKRLKEPNSLRTGIATFSFTNVAHEEIGQQLQSLGCPPVPPYPHFLGTIDHFINTWIFLPFGHLVMECDERPEIKGFQGNIWNPTGYEWLWKKKECHQNECNLIDFTYDMNGELFNLKREINCPFDQSECKRLKERFRARGYATQADANYWAMKILKTYPKVAKALGRRFPEVIIDEAQDTSDIQMRIVDLLVA
jgi:DNA helicase-2/ATP-dependent DNA helicase PcrA